jgi:hypothetical protein
MAADALFRADQIQEGSSKDAVLLDMGLQMTPS